MVVEAATRELIPVLAPGLVNNQRPYLAFCYSGVVVLKIVDDCITLVESFFVVFIDKERHLVFATDGQELGVGLLVTNITVSVAGVMNNI